ncbi:MAG: hypothetical protein ACXVP1_06140 [Thermoleophilia bacterium]
MSTISTEVRSPVVGLPDEASARIVALPCGRFRLRARDGLLATSVGQSSLRVENGVVRLSSRRPPRWSAVAAPFVPLGFAAAAALFVLGPSPLTALLVAWATAVVMAVIAILRGVLASREEATVNAADTFVVAVKRPLGLDSIEGLLAKVEWLLPRPLADLVGRRVVVVEAPFGADRLAIRRRLLVPRRVATAQALVRALKTARVPRNGA